MVAFSMSSLPRPKYLNPGDGEAIVLLGEPRVLKMTPTENAGACLQFETSHAPGTRVPPHLHYEEDEAFHVLTGKYEFEVEDSRFTATVGTFVFAPSGAVHGFTNTGPDTARMLVTVMPGLQHESFFIEVTELATQLGRSPDADQLIALTVKYGWVWIR